MTVRATLFMTSRESAGVTLPLEFRVDFQAFLRVKCNITVISLLLGKYTRTFVPRFPGIPEMLYFPMPEAEGNITFRGFPGTWGQTFWYISLNAMKYLYNILFYFLIKVLMLDVSENYFFFIKILFLSMLKIMFISKTCLYSNYCLLIEHSGSIPRNTCVACET